jgi:Tol biopolymer transport system component
MRRALMLAMVAAMGAELLAAQATRIAEVELKTTQHQAEVEGDLKGAIQSYSAIMAKYKNDRGVVARALVKMADCYQKMGDAKARRIYEKVVNDYADQKEAAAEARARLGGGAAGRTGAEPVARRVWAAEEAGTDFFNTVNLQVSPDGRRAVFADWKNGNLAVRDLQIGETRFLTHGTADGHVQDLVFSPDGKQVAYRRAGKLEAEPIRVVGVEGTHMRDVTVLKYGTFLFAWSPDGKRIAATQYDSAGKTAQIVLQSVADGSITRLKTTGWAPPPVIGGFSPDGRYLVYSLRHGSSRPQNGIFAIAVDGSREEALVQGLTNDVYPTWTPDGRGVVFLSDRSGTKDLWFVRVVDGRPQGDPELVRAQVGAIDLKGFGRDGSLYFGTNRLESDMYQIEIDSEKLTAGAPVRITDRFIGSNYEAEPSPDGKLLAFFRGTPGDPSLEPATLLVRPIATRVETPLASGIPAYYQSRSIGW